MITKPRILMIAPQCYPPAGAEAIVTAKLLLTFLEAGWEVDVIGQTEAGQFYPSDPEGVWSPLRGVVNNIDVGCAGRLGGGNGLLKRSLLRTQSFTWAIRAVFLARRLASRKKYDAMLSRVAPQYGHIPALILSLFSDLPWIANWSDPMPPQKGPPPYGKGPDASVPAIMRWYIAAVVRNADWHTFPNERLRRYMCSYLPGLEAKSSVIPHVALESFKIRRVPDPTKFSLCHIGGLGVRKPDVFLAGVKLFLERTRIDIPVTVKFVGLGLDELENKIVELGLHKVVTLIGAKTYETAQKFAAVSTVLVVIEAQCHEGIFLPSKVVDFVQTGRPILAVSPRTGVLADLLSRSGGGLAVSCDSIEEVAEAVGKLYFSWLAGRLDEEFGSEKLMEVFSDLHVLKEYQVVFDRVQKHAVPRSEEIN